MKISKTVWKMIVVMLVSALVLIIAGAIASLHFPLIRPIAFALGVMLTSALNVLKTIWMERTAYAVANVEDQARAVNMIRIQYFIRFLLTAVVLVIAVYVPFIDLWGAVAGIFTFHAARYALYFIIKAEEAESQN